VLAGLGLDAGLLIHAEQHCVLGDVLVEVTDLLSTGEETGVVGAVEPAPDLVRLDVGLGQDPPDLAGRDANAPGGVQVLRDQPVRPLRISFGWLAGRGRHDQQPHVQVVDQRPTRTWPVP
jgi:hypothetical protein